MTVDVQELAVRLDEAVGSATPIPQLSAEHPLTLDDAYAVQAAGVALREGRGDVAVGVKLGFTSKAKAAQMGVDDVIVGVVHRAMAVADGGAIDIARMVHPRIEPEVAFRLGSEIDPHAGAGDDADIVAATTEVAPAMEVIDSRYRDFRFSLSDVVADNASAAGFVLGPWRRFAEVRAAVDLAALEVVLTVNGAEAARGSTADILGDPVRALGAVKRMAREHGLALPAGSIVLAGAATAAVPLHAGATVVADLPGLGRVVAQTPGDGDHG